ASTRNTTAPCGATLLQHAPDQAGRQRNEQPEQGERQRTRLRRGELAAAPLGEPRWWRPQHAVHRYAGAGTCRADTAASGGMMCLSYPATRHDSTCGRTSVPAEPDDLYVEAMRDELPLSRA